MAETGATSAATSEYAASEMPVSEAGEGAPAGFPPYPPYATQPAPPSVVDTIMAGRDLRVQHKSTPKETVRLPPKPARPRGPKATDVKMTKRAVRAHARCLRRHGAVLTDRLERMSKPPRRAIIYLWREYAHTLPAEAIARLRSMLDADEPFKPDQAYEYFVNLRKTKKKVGTSRGVSQIKKDMLAMCADKRFEWARNATVAFARGIQQRLSRPGVYTLADGMLRLSNIILEDICGYMSMRLPSRRCTHPKAKFMMEMSDKVAVWIDEILAESDNRMLMMDFDEDDDIIGADEVGDTGFADDFLNMMGDTGGLLKGRTYFSFDFPHSAQPAYLKFTGEMLEGFMILTDSMYKKGDEQLLAHGKFKETFSEGADELKHTLDFEAIEYNSTLANKLKEDLTATAKPNTSSNIVPFMKDVVDICSNFLTQNAEFNKDKGPAFKLLIKAMHSKGNEQLYSKGKATRVYSKAAKELDNARGLESDHGDPNLSQEIHSKLSKLVEKQTPPDLKSDMKDTLDTGSKYLSQCAIDEIERGPAFDILIKELEKKGAEPFTPQYSPIATKYATAYTLKSAPGFSGVTPDPSTSPVFASALHKSVDTVTPKVLVRDMNEVIIRCSNYLSAFVRDRDKSLQSLLKMMKSNPKKELVKRNNYEMNYESGAEEVEAAPVLVPFLPIKDVADDAKGNLTTDMANLTPPELHVSMKALIQDVSRYLSQPFAIRSGIAGDRYPLNFLAAVKKSLGTRPLYKYKSYGQTYTDAAEVLKYAGPLESDPKCENLQYEISSEMKRGIPSRIASTITNNLNDTMDDASKHLAKVGTEKGEALQHLVNLMKEEGETPLGQIQGYQQSYKDGARRIENTTSLNAEKIDRRVYESVRGKLGSLIEKKPSPEHAKQMPGIVDESSKFLASPLPETEAEKRKLLADLMARKEDEIIGQEGIYKLTYTEAGNEIMNAPVGVTQSQDENIKREMLHKINFVIPEKKLQDLLKETVTEGATHLANLLKGRGAAMQVIHDGMIKEKDKDFLSVGKFSKTHEQAAEMLEQAPHFGGQHPSSILVDKVADRIKEIPTSGAPEKAKPYITETSDIVTQYIAGVATCECGLDAKALAALDGKGFKEDTRVTRPKSSSEPMIKTASKSTIKILSEPAVKVVSKPRIQSASEPVIRPSDDEKRRQREAEEAAKKQAEEEERKKREATAAAEAAAASARRRRALEAEKRRRAGSQGYDYDPEREQAMQILQDQLSAHGTETFYKLPHTELSHTQASEWLSITPLLKVDKCVKESGDTARLHKKFERKLSALVAKVTTSNIYDTMQDVIIESARILSEYFVSKSYKMLVRVALISEMQKRGNEILIEVDGASETYFFAAQRLKKAESLEVAEPCSQVAYYLTKKLEDMIRCRSMARKLTSAMKGTDLKFKYVLGTTDHIKDTADYLSAYVTKPDEQIEAYVALLNEMESAGDTSLIEGDIPKSQKAAAAYLRQLTSFRDEISQPNASLQSTTEGKLKNLMSTVAENGYTKAVMDGVITESTRLLVSYIVLQGMKTEALKVLIEYMDRDGQNVLLRHGTLRKTYSDGADILRPKNADQLGVLNADPVAARKIQIKLRNLMYSCTPDKYQTLMDDVIEDATLFMAVHFLQPRLIQVCKCMKNVFVQCELWCDEILRRVARPCCTCSRHISVQALADLVPLGQRMCISPGSSRAYAPGIEISLRTCPSQQNKLLSNSTGNPDIQPCPAKNPTQGCKQKATTSYMLYSTAYDQRYPRITSPERLPSSSDSLKVLSSLFPSPLSEAPLFLDSPMHSEIFSEKCDQKLNVSERVEQPLIRENIQETDTSSPTSFYTPYSAKSNSLNTNTAQSCWHTPLTNYARVHTTIEHPTNQTTSSRPSDPVALPRKMSSVKRGYTARAPIVTTDQMADWHAMMVSLMWNVQAWRAWIQENINRAVIYQANNNCPGQPEESWTIFQRRVSTEALQWRQYNNFSRQLTLRLALRYRDKKILSPTRATVKTEIYMECQDEMLDIIDMFNRWTRWLTVVIRETDSLPQRTDSQVPAFELRWKYFKKKVEEYLEDWNKYNTHLKVCWEQKYRILIADLIPAASWTQPGPVWVVSACGAVPSGAVAAGIYEGEVTWVSRTTHRCNVLPAALRPSKHCCVVYGDGGVHHYTKYQVMCNAEVSWVACRANGVGSVGNVSGVGSLDGVGEMGTRAVRVASGVYIGRVHYRGSHLVGAVHAPAYRCHVVIFGRTFAFNCYELLVLTQDDG